MNTKTDRPPQPYFKYIDPDLTEDRAVNKENVRHITEAWRIQDKMARIKAKSKLTAEDRENPVVYEAYTIHNTIMGLLSIIEQYKMKGQSDAKP